MQRTMTTRVYPAIGHLKLDKITSRDIQKFINDLAVNGKNLQNGQPLSRKTLVHHLSFISSVFNYAKKMDMIKDNPCSRVTVPKGEKKEKEIYTIEEVEQLFSLLETAPVKYRAFFMLAIYSGFRSGEMLGLEWKDIDWEHNVISIHRTANNSKPYGNYTDTTKTKRSERSSKLSPVVMNMLKQLKSDRNTTKRCAATSGRKLTEYLFTMTARRFTSTVRTGGFKTSARRMISGSVTFTLIAIFMLQP